MKHVIFILSFSLTCCTVFSQQAGVDKTDKDIRKFNKFLGQDKATALDQAVESLDNFLTVNYPDQKTQKERTRAFLQQLSTSLAPDSNWTFDTETNKVILRKLETSGMRQEIKLYGYEEYTPKYFIDNLNLQGREDSITELGELTVELEEELIPVSREDSAEQAKREAEMQSRLDSSLWFNTMGQFLYGLAKYAPNDTLVQEYTEARQAAGNISVNIIIDAYLNQYIDYDNPFFKRMVVADLYMDLMKWDIDRKK